MLFFYFMAYFKQESYSSPVCYFMLEILQETKFFTTGVF